MRDSQSGGWFVALVVVFALATPAVWQWTHRAAPAQQRPAVKDGFDADQDPSPEEATPRIVIVGAGISGLSAALELGRAGVPVIVVDQSSVFGGHAVMSQGGVSIVGTPVQKEAGFDDSPDLAYRDFITWGEDADEHWVRYYVDHSRKELFDWLVDLGVRFSGVDTAPGNSVDRFHQPEGRGIGLVTPIYRECLELPHVTFRWNCKADELLIDEEQVTGVVVRDVRTGEREELVAASVILATGGFQSNLAMVRQYWPQQFRFPKLILAGSGINSVGSGHRLAESAGGHLVKMDHQWNYFTGIPDPRYPDSDRGISAANMYGIIVNPDGNRFANLHNWAKEVMPRMLAQDDATLWFVFDEGVKREFVISGSDWADFRRVEELVLHNPKLVKVAPSLAALAEKTGLPAANLEQTIARYNVLVDSGVDSDFHRFGPGRPTFSNDASPKLNTPPYYAMQAYPLTRKSMGGVAIDAQCRVVEPSGKPIPGLYAVGELTGLAGINGKAALEGTFLGPCIMTGRVAAKSILSADVVKRTPFESQSCVECHDVAALVETPREGYWHFEQSHKAALERELDCRQCHAELAPYREDAHVMHPQSLSTTCVLCHLAQE